ncbi:MAG: hypothetical protein R3D67_14000 [Hyphomicrobiaceae bacterium]
MAVDLASAHDQEGGMSMMPKWLRGASLYTLLLALVTGGIVHISATLALPHLAKANAFQRLTAALPVNTMQVLPAAGSEGSPIPYLGPDVRMAICRYDIATNPLSLILTLPDQGWTLGLYTDRGDNFYVLPSQSQRLTEIKLTLIAKGERSFSLLTLGRPAAIQSISQIEVPEPHGFAVIRAPMRGRAFAGEIEQTLRRARCGISRE